MNKTFKKTLSLLLAVLVAISVLPAGGIAMSEFVINAFASDIGVVAEGDCGADGSDVRWTLYESGKLVISGSGAMRDYDGWFEDTEEPTEDSALWIGKKAVECVVTEGVTSIGRYAFLGCPDIVGVVLADSVTSIGESAFSGCKNLKEIKMSDNIVSLGDYAFCMCESLDGVVMPSGVTDIGRYAFAGCSSLTKITLPDGIETVSDYMFSDCTALTEVILPNTVTTLENGVFNGCVSLEKIEISDGVTSFGSGVFFKCSSLKSVKLPDGIVKITNGMFGECVSLTEFDAGQSVNGISFMAFDGCTSLSDIYIRNPQCEIFDAESTVYPDTVIHGYLNSTAQSYAKKYNRTFVPIDHEHDFVSVVTKEADCTHDGEITYTCTTPGCGFRYVESVPALGHVDGDNDGKCDVCGEVTASVSCDCVCHSNGGFVRFFWNIIRLFCKIFKTNEFCKCGAKHW